MKPDEIRTRILEEHEKLRVMLDELDDLNKRFENNEEAMSSEIRELGAGLFESLAAHLALEDAMLVPALEATKDGAGRGARLKREHVEQRAILRYLLGRLEEEGRPTALVANELRSFSVYLRRDMQHEEQPILQEGLLRANG